MPRYRVLAPGFYGSVTYDPNGKRRVLYIDKPFPSKNKKEQVPSWLKRMSEESTEQKADREAREADQLAADVDKVDQDQKDVVDMTFMGTGESSDVIETL